LIFLPTFPHRPGAEFRISRSWKPTTDDKAEITLLGDAFGAMQGTKGPPVGEPVLDADPAYELDE
jgi:hypothetical protein